MNRQFNAANETTSVSGGAAPTYDAVGNTTVQDGRTYVYDAWNRLKQVKSGSTLLASYAYDALRRRVVETSGGTTTAVEERIGTFGYHNVIGATGQTVFRDVTIPGGANPDWRTYAQQNANGDVVALIGHGTAAGNVVERYAYAPYGAVSILDAAGAPIGSSPYQWRQLFQGGRFDATTGLYVFGFRDYDPATGVWRQRDPIGLAGGDVNLYRFVGNNPVTWIDPSGLSGWMTFMPGYKTADLFYNACRGNDKVQSPCLATGFRQHAKGRWPANVIHDGSEEVWVAFPDASGRNGARPVHGQRVLGQSRTQGWLWAHQHRTRAGVFQDRPCSGCFRRRAA